MSTDRVFWQLEIVKKVYNRYRLLRFQVFQAVESRKRGSLPLCYGWGEVGKISDLITTGTAPEDWISAPISM